MSANKGIILSTEVLFNNIRPGDETHDDVARLFNVFFGKYNRNTKIFLSVECNGSEKHLVQVPCHVLKVSFEKCKEYMFHGPVMQAFKENWKQYNLPNFILELLNPRSMMDSGSKEEIGISQIYSLESCQQINDDTWNQLKAAYGCLLHISECRRMSVLEDLQREVAKVLPKNIEGISDRRYTAMVKDAVELAWKMVMLVPPALVCQPNQYSSELMSWNVCFWNEEESDISVIFFKPVMYYSSLGHVTQRGVVGNTVKNNMKIIECGGINYEESSAHVSNHTSDQDLDKLSKTVLNPTNSNVETEMKSCAESHPSSATGTQGFVDNEKVQISKQDEAVVDESLQEHIDLPKQRTSSSVGDGTAAEFLGNELSVTIAQNETEKDAVITKQPWSSRRSFSEMDILPDCERCDNIVLDKFSRFCSECKETNVMDCKDTATDHVEPPHQPPPQSIFQWFTRWFWRS